MAALEAGPDPDPDLSLALHHTLAALTQVRAGSGRLPRQQLKEKLELLVWLSAELSAACGLLVKACLDAGVELQELTRITGLSAEDIRASGRPFGWVLQSADQPAVDDKVRAGDVSRAAAGRQQD
jgi:hypothetical protein